jgi:LuxR family maltose regulon positive regulatory protein
MTAMISDSLPEARGPVAPWPRGVGGEVMQGREAKKKLVPGRLRRALRGAQPSQPALAPSEPARPRESLTQSETRVLRYLPTHLYAPEIADELCVSVNTVKTHLRHLYQKLGARTRGEAVERARAFGLLAPSPMRLTATKDEA